MLLFSGKTIYSSHHCMLTYKRPESIVIHIVITPFALSEQKLGFHQHSLIFASLFSFICWSSSLSLLVALLYGWADVTFLKVGIPNCRLGIYNIFHIFYFILTIVCSGEEKRRQYFFYEVIPKSPLLACTFSLPWTKHW